MPSTHPGLLPSTTYTRYSSAYLKSQQLGGGSRKIKKIKAVLRHVRSSKPGWPTQDVAFKVKRECGGEDTDLKTERPSSNPTRHCQWWLYDVISVLAACGDRTPDETASRRDNFIWLMVSEDFSSSSGKSQSPGMGTLLCV